MNPDLTFSINYLIICNEKSGQFHTALEYRITWNKTYQGEFISFVDDPELIADWIILANLPDDCVMQPRLYTGVDNSSN